MLSLAPVSPDRQLCKVAAGRIAGPLHRRRCRRRLLVGLLLCWQPRRLLLLLLLLGTLGVRAAAARLLALLLRLLSVARPVTWPRGLGRPGRPFLTLLPVPFIHLHRAQGAQRCCRPHAEVSHRRPLQPQHRGRRCCPCCRTGHGCSRCGGACLLPLPLLLFVAASCFLLLRAACCLLLASLSWCCCCGGGGGRHRLRLVLLRCTRRLLCGCGCCLG